MINKFYDENDLDTIDIEESPRVFTITRNGENLFNGNDLLAVNNIGNVGSYDTFWEAFNALVEQAIYWEFDSIIIEWKLDQINDPQTVKDIDPDYLLVTDSQEILAVGELIGMNVSDYGCLFVKVGEGEYTSVYGCETSVPWNYKRVDKLL